MKQIEGDQSCEEDELAYKVFVSVLRPDAGIWCENIQ